MIKFVLSNEWPINTSSNMILNQVETDLLDVLALDWLSAVSTRRNPVHVEHSTKTTWCKGQCYLALDSNDGMFLV